MQREMAGDDRSRQGVGFQGDMNEYARLAQNRTNNPPMLSGPSFERPNYSQRQQTDLFSEDFLKNMRQAGLVGADLSQLQGALPSQIGNQQSSHSQRNNENLNIINSIFGNPVAPQFQLGQNQGAVGTQSQAESDRERRLQLRDMERKKRMEGIVGGDYGHVGQPANAQSQLAAPMTAEGNSRREQIWQQKMIQRVQSQEGPRQVQQQQVQFQQPISIQNQLPVASRDVPALELSDSVGQIRSSRIQNQLSSAIQLDQSLNYQELQKLQQNQAANVTNQNQQQPPSRPQSHQQQNPLLGGDDEVIRKRREAERRQRNQDYNVYLSKQASQQQLVNSIQTPLTAQGPKIITSYPAEAPLGMFQPPQSLMSQPGSAKNARQSSSNENKSGGASSSVLQAAGGLNLLGLHQLKKDEDKIRMQKEYRDMLDVQAQSKKNQDDPMAIQARRKHLSDQVFAEVANQATEKGVYIAPQYNHQQAPMMTPPAIMSSKPPQPPTNKIEKEMFFGGQNDDDRKRMEHEKKREYGVFLQQQMAAAQEQKAQSSDSDSRRRRGGSIQPHQQSQADQAQLGYQQQLASRVFDYQVPPAMNNYQPQLPSPSYPYQAGFQGNFQPPAPYLDPQYPSQQQQQLPLSVAPQPQAPYQLQLNLPTQQDPSKDVLRQRQEDYRRDLELQIKQRDDQKQLRQLKEKQVDEIFGPVPPTAAGVVPQNNNANPNARPNPTQPHHPSSVSEPPSQRSAAEPQQPGNFVRQRTDLTGNANQDDPDRKSRQQQYQDELKRQVEDRTRQKEEEKRKIREEEEIIERRMQQQQQEISQKEQRELQKEGRQVKEEKKRNVRRDLFEPSSDNPTAQYGNQPKVRQEEAPVKKEEKQSVSQPQAKQAIEVPNYQNRRDDNHGYQASLNDQQTRMSYEPAPISQAPLFPTSSMLQGSQLHSSGLQQQSYLHDMPSSSYSQYPPQHPPLTASNLRTNAPYEDDYGKMIQMYQHAFQEVIDFKNQYMEEVMKMRERVIREREEILEYERMKHQQSMELQNLRAVYDKLGDMLRPEDSSNQIVQRQLVGQMNPNVQQNLNSLLMKQQQDVLRMSQSGMRYAQVAEQQNQKQYPPIQPAYIQQAQQQIIQIVNPRVSNPYNNQLLQESPNMLEQSLSSDTKFVVVPQNRLNQAHNTQKVNLAGTGQLMQTWTDETLLEPPSSQAQIKIQNPSLSTHHQALAQLQAFNQSIAQSLQSTSQLVIANTSLGPQGTAVTSTKMIPRPPTQTHGGGLSTVPPETIQELPPNQEDEATVIQSKPTTVRDPISRTGSSAQQHRVRPTAIVPRGENEEDFNSRESSEEGRKLADPQANKSKIYINDKESNSSRMNLADESSFIEQQSRSRVISEEKKTPQSRHDIQPASSHQPPPFGNAITNNMKQIDHLLGMQQPPKSKESHVRRPVPTLSIEKHHEDLKQRSDIKSSASPMNQSQSYQKTQQKTQEKFHNAGVTGSSFYNATMQLQKQQEQTQQEELQKQLMRIYGSSSISYEAANSTQQQQKDAVKRASTPPRQDDPLGQVSFKPNTAARVGTGQMASEDQELLRQTSINIADSMNEDTQKQFKNNIAIINRGQSIAAASGGQQPSHRQVQHQTSSGNVIYQQQIAAISVHGQYSAVNGRDSSLLVDDQDPEEVQMNQQPRIVVPNKSLVYHKDFELTGESADPNDVWNDPELVPPPVVMLDQEDEEYGQDQYYNEQEDPGENQNHQYYANFQGYPQALSNENTSMNGATLNHLKLLSPPSQTDGYDPNAKINLGTYNQDLFMNDLKQNQSIEQPVIFAEQKLKSPLKRPPMSAKPGSSRQGGNDRQAQTSEDSPSMSQKAGGSTYKQEGIISLKPTSAAGVKGKDQRLNTASPSRDAPLQVPAAFDDVSDRSMSKKERDILDVMKMIQKASSSVLDATDQFKFRLKKAPVVGGGQDKDAQSVRSQQRQQLHSAKAATSHRPESTQMAEEIEHNLGYEEDAEQLVIGESSGFPPRAPADKDNQILSNIDMIIQNLQEQKGRFVTQSGLFDIPKHSQDKKGSDKFQIAVETECEEVEEEESQRWDEPSVDPIAAMNDESRMHGLRLRGNEQPSSRPISGLQLNVNLSQPSRDNSKMSQGNASNFGYQQQPQPVGKFTQMALNNIKGVVPDENQFLHDLNKKYPDASPSQQHRGLHPVEQQVILRPVSGKSNSNRYEGGNHGRSKSRSQDRHAVPAHQNQNYYYEDDEEDEQELQE